ncbi:hypothetical protein HNE05_17770 [Aquipseudomonas campi]|uniref:Uncharacterized protein n=1 Tax=Aquipseudomonas campi TaxID=2731681 RepID=A0A6M8F8J4_9GAMM|nr:hypothetical protein [Pseudomonas campi]QKE65124.1 hypothetical protein HNE05_17770 [Pseudomonas campi]
MRTLALAAVAGLLLFFHAREGWVPILDSANLAFHEAGHPLFGLVSSRLMVYGGTFMQLLLPLTAAWQLRRQQQIGGYHLCLIWLAENLLNVSRYMADARRQELPLVGGGDHDWTYILSSWGLLSWDTTLAMWLRVLAVGLMVWVLWRDWRQVRPAEE